MMSALYSSHHPQSAVGVSGLANIIFRKAMVSINYCIPPADSGNPQHPKVLSVDIPFVCDTLSINEIQVKLEKILSLARMTFLSSNKKEIYQQVGAKRYLQLSSMENQVLHYLGKGCCAQDIAAELGCTEKTVSTHSRNAMRKMGIVKKSELYHYAAWVVQHTDKERITLCL